MKCVGRFQGVIDEIRDRNLGSLKHQESEFHSGHGLAAILSRYHASDLWMLPGVSLTTLDSIRCYLERYQLELNPQPVTVAGQLLQKRLDNVKSSNPAFLKNLKYDVLRQLKNKKAIAQSEMHH